MGLFSVQVYAAQSYLDLRQAPYAQTGFEGHSILAYRRPELKALPWPGVIDSHQGWMIIPTAVRHLARVRVVADYLATEMRHVVEIAQRGRTSPLNQRPSPHSTRLEPQADELYR